MKDLGTKTIKHWWMKSKKTAIKTKEQVEEREVLYTAGRKEDW
jgi:hypothetical protein